MTTFNTWAIAGTNSGQTYPCQCTERRRCDHRCPCHGRTDHPDMLPTRCCRRRAAEAERRRAQHKEAG